MRLQGLRLQGLGGTTLLPISVTGVHCCYLLVFGVSVVLLYPVTPMGSIPSPRSRQQLQGLGGKTWSHPERLHTDGNTAKRPLFQNLLSLPLSFRVNTCSLLPCCSVDMLWPHFGCQAEHLFQPGLPMWPWGDRTGPRAARPSS